DKKTFTRLIKEMEENEDEPFCYSVYGDDLNLMWEKFCAHYELITAGGGLVRNTKNKILFIFRNGTWDFPKGKSEPGDNIEETALREVMEECAIRNLRMEKFLIDTYHTYGSPPKRKLKKTSWFRMFTEDKNLQPQEEEGITKVKWF